MKTKPTILLAALGLAVCLQSAQAQLLIPSDGSDGAMAPDGATTNVVIDLSRAVTGDWNVDNSANAGKGIYDPSKWAVVFKYSSVNIPAGVTVSFINHPTHAPVVWLVQGSVTNFGMIDLSGGANRGGVNALVPVEPAPGGFRGAPSGPAGSGYGLGPGGSPQDGNGFPTAASYNGVYGNPQILPLIGGSGTSGGGGYSGGGGGGAILIAASGVLHNDGVISAAGGWVSMGSYGASRLGSGGAVKVIASRVSGAGEINCLGGGPGRTRIQTDYLAPSLRVYPETIAATNTIPPQIWPPETTPTVRIVSVGPDASTNASVFVPADPTAPLVSSADVAIENEAQAVITLETKNLPIEGVVQVRAASKWGGASWVNASYASGDRARATWLAPYTFPKGYTTLQARATAP